MTKTSLMVAPIKPTRILNSRCGKAGIYLFGTPYDFGPQGDAAIIKETLKFYISNGVKNVLAPSCKKFNAEIVCENDLRHKIRLRGGLVIHQGVFADGVILNKKKEAFFIPSADCSTIIVTGNKLMIATHAGRDCLIDKGEIHTGKPSRKHRSVVDAMMEKLIMAGENKKTLRVFITCGIKAENFPHPINHPQHGGKNKILIKHLLAKYGGDCLKGKPEEGFISLDNLIKIQFIRHGVPPENIANDGIDTYGDNILGKYLWHSCARGKTEREKKRRNGILVIKNF